MSRKDILNDKIKDILIKVNLILWTILIIAVIVVAIKSCNTKNTANKYKYTGNEYKNSYSQSQTRTYDFTQGTRSANVAPRSYVGDDYDVDDYADPEEFYHYNYDNFYDYEDAENYYNEHQ